MLVPEVKIEAEQSQSSCTTATGHPTQPQPYPWVNKLEKCLFFFPLCSSQARKKEPTQWDQRSLAAAQPLSSML